MKGLAQKIISDKELEKKAFLYLKIRAASGMLRRTRKAAL